MKVWLLDPAAMTPDYNASLAAALRARGIAVRLLTSRSLYDESPPPVGAEYFFFKPLERWAGLLSRRRWLRRMARLLAYCIDVLWLWRALRQDAPDVVHVQWTLVPAVDRWLFRRVAARTPLVLTVHDTAPRQASLARIADMRPLYRLATRLIVHAEENRRTLLVREAVEPSTIQVVPHGPSFEGVEERPREEARAALGIEAGSVVILFFGLIKPYKGLIDLIEAAGSLRLQFPDMRLVIAGKPEGPFEPYHAAIAAHRLEAITSLHLDFIPTEQVPDYFVASDIVCLPYRAASQSGVLLAAYRFGRPVVVTAVGALPESVEEGTNGYVVPPADSAALAGALGRLLADAALRERFGQRSRELVRERMGWARAAGLTEQVYRQAIADHELTSPHNAKPGD